MKVLLVQDVYKLGRAGEVKKVANGYGRNYLMPQGLAVLATPAALKQVDRIRQQADVQRAVINEEMSGIAANLEGLRLVYPVKASETGKLYGSITPQMITDSINEKLGTEISRRQVDAEPIRTLGVHKVNIRLTIDLIPEISVIVHREGEAPETAEQVSPALSGETEGPSIFEEVMDEGIQDEVDMEEAGVSPIEQEAETALEEVDEDTPA